MRFLLVVLVIGLFITLSQILVSSIEWFVGFGDGARPLGFLALAAILLRATYVISQRVSA